ncbi:Dynein assembly factor 3, axonemal homolog, partial [Gryllus bimaculatus]
MAALWERRLRRALGVRYDSREGVFDWDYHMRLRDLCGDAITLRDAPYAAFGVECEDEDLLRSVNGMRPHTATDISERNLMRLFHELQHSTPFVAPKAEDAGAGGVVITELPDARDDWGAGA